MLKITLLTLTALSSIGAAHGQSADHNRLSSTADVNYARTGTPGTVGAMDAVVHGLATSAEDVALQQHGRSTLAEGAHELPNAKAENLGYSPGTVGAAPGQ